MDMKKFFVFMMAAAVVMVACKHKGEKSEGETDSVVSGDSVAVEENMRDTTPRPMFLMEVGDGVLEMLYWTGVEEPNRKETGEEYYLAAYDNWAMQEGFRKNRERYTNLIAEGKVVKVKYVDEVLKDPDGEWASLGEIHGREGIPAMGARYKAESKKDNGKLWGGQVVVTDSYLEAHKLLSVKEKGTNEGVRINSQKLPSEVVKGLEKKYGMKAAKSIKVCVIDGRYVFGSLQFKGEYKDGPKDPYDKDRKYALALDVLIDGENVYVNEVLGYYFSDGDCGWNADDDGEYIPCTIEAAFEGKWGLEICYKRYAPESATTGMFYMPEEGDKLVQVEYECYHVMIDEELPIWKSEVMKYVPEMKKQAAKALVMTPKEAAFDEYALIHAGYGSYREVYARNKKLGLGAVYSIADGKVELLASAFGGALIVFYERGVGSVVSCGSGCMKNEFCIVEDDRAAEKFGVVEKSGPGGKKEFSYTKGGKEIGDEEFQALKNRLGNEWERNEEYMEWKSLK